MPKEIRKAQMPKLSLKAHFRPESIDRENRTVEVVMTTGESGKRYDRYNDRFYNEELQIDGQAVRTARLDKGIPLMADHDQYSGIRGVLGTTENYRFENGQLIGTVRFSKREEVNPIFEDVADGVLRHVSLGYKVHKYEQTKARGEGELDTYRAVDLEPLELSLVAIPFETTNGVRAERQDDNETTFDVIIEEREMPETKIEKEKVDEVRSAQDIKPVVEEVRTEPKIDAVAITGKTRAELTPMIDAARKAGLDIDLAVRHFEQGTSIENFRALVLDELESKNKERQVKTQGAGMILNSDQRSDERNQTRSAVESALMIRSGIRDIEQTPEIRNHQGLTLHEIGRACVERTGVNTQGMSRMQIADRAFHSTSDFPLILENVMNKSLRVGYTETPRTFLELGQRSEVNDFREKHSYVIGDAPSLLPLGENGEYQNGTFSESKESYRIKTFARKLGFTREMMINDDMSALSKFPKAFGAAGSRLESDVVWGLLLNYDFTKNVATNVKMADGKALFHTDHNNLLTNGSAFSKAALTASRKLGRKMKTLDGQFMNLMFNTIAISEDLETVVEDTLFNNYVAQTGASSVDQFKNKYKVIVEPRLAVVDPAAWYAFSNMIDTFEYSYLAGEAEMYTEVVQSHDVDGLMIKVRKDFGAGILEYRGMQKSTGAA